MESNIVAALGGGIVGAVAANVTLQRSADRQSLVDEMNNVAAALSGLGADMLGGKQEARWRKVGSSLGSSSSGLSPGL